MPRVKIDYIVSFSSEDPEHPASNLLAWEVSKKKWLCKKGETSCSVVFQLTKAVKISAVQIGAYHSSLVEVLVARSETASDQFQVLVPSCVFVSPAEARRDVPVERVRLFSGEQLAADCRPHRWDRVRVVCSQPYSRHAKFGLSFIHIDSPEAPTPAPERTRAFALDALSSDDEDFRPGELFSQHLQKNSNSQSSLSDTGAQIRQATSQALKNIPESSTKLIKTVISKPHSQRHDASASGRGDRTRDSLMYTHDDDKPHAKIDHVVQRHRLQQEEDGSKAQPAARQGLDAGSGRAEHSRRRSSPATERNSGAEHQRRQPASDDSDREGAECSEPHAILRGAVVVLSGYENPERAELRRLALALGARVQRDWGPRATHLVCAFPSTPKARAARAAGGRSVPVALGAWLREMAAARRRVPWRWHAAEPRDRRPRRRRASECDTDDEIDKVLQKKAKRTATSARSPSTDSERGAASPAARFGGALPSFFDGYTFVLGAHGASGALLARYVRAYGGLVLQECEVEQDSAVDFVVGASETARNARRVQPAWLARCHAAGEML